MKHPPTEYATFALSFVLAVVASPRARADLRQAAVASLARAGLAGVETAASGAAQLAERLRRPGLAHEMRLVASLASMASATWGQP